METAWYIVKSDPAPSMSNTVEHLSYDYSTAKRLCREWVRKNNRPAWLQAGPLDPFKWYYYGTDGHGWDRNTVGGTQEF